ncbi:hypothetical protein PF008_g6365 [Phytophthora fragariae]|uniref:Uncharacterized protein n=1 Tax=Phytophthora fragariae TaxID=53985 RepID=A0A6G0S5W8_9STRA|nr:hypothetical protein PF008_g6365 [Phytophthora fragariae]
MGKPAWFDLEPEERTRVLQKWKRVVIAEQCYGALSGVFEDEPSVHPVNGGVEFGADETEASTTPVPPDTTSKSKKRTRDAAADMEVVMDKAAKAVRKASRREFEEYSKQPERRTRRRTLCYASCSVNVSEIELPLIYPSESPVKASSRHVALRLSNLERGHHVLRVGVGRIHDDKEWDRVVLVQTRQQASGSVRAA